MRNNDENPLKERRADERYDVALDIEWSADGNLRSGRLSNVSSAGCFVLTGGEFENGELVRVYFPITDGSRFEVVGEIINCDKDIGFGVRFVNLNDIQRRYLQNFAEVHQNELSKPAE